ncbi:MAG: (d)CMP kinase [Flavobacterium sp.]|jgi:cytidylate kinase
MIIAIDGHSSTGKSSTAKELAKHLNYIYVDTGAMYRAVTYFAFQKGLVSDNHLDTQKLIEELSNVHLKFVTNEVLGTSEMFLNNENVEKAIRTMEVSQLVSKIAAISEVRKKLVEQQQKMGKNNNLIMDGRDIGTIVFPNADLKIFMTANAQIRAERRYQELLNSGQKITFEEVFKNIEDRDFIDSNREDSPLKKAEDAIVIDNSFLSKQEQFEMILKLVNF